MATIANQQNHISVADISDVSEIMRYIDTEWKQGHILSRDEAFFLYEYQNRDKLNFVISKGGDGKINGMLGFIKASAEDDSAVWTTMWKVSRSAGAPMLGIQLLEFLRSLGYRSVMSLGINAKTIDIYKYLRFSVGQTRHYYMPNRELDDYQILSLQTAASGAKELPRNSAYSLKKLSAQDAVSYFAALPARETMPKKDLGYFRRRFCEHPIYSYELYGIFKQASIAAIVVARVVQAVNRTAMRIVDVFGDEQVLVFGGVFLAEIMQQAGHEYIDLVCFGVEHELLRQAGFDELDLNGSDVIVPNYFSPFVRENITINFFVDEAIGKSLRFFKADGDQDRPT